MMITTSKIGTDQLIASMHPLDVAGNSQGVIRDLVYDSRKAGPGCAFFALRGISDDGHQFIADAVDRGAELVVMEEPHPVKGATGIVVANARQALAEASALFFGQPTRTMRVVGVTGTNGKTTVTYLIEAMLIAARQRPAVVGTVNYRYQGSETPASHTTPESYDLQKLTADFLGQGADSLVLEVSSHALEQNRVSGINFEVGIFTNLTPEHLDYHQTMESYFSSKKKFYDDYIVPQGSRAVVNIDDPYGRRIADELDDALTCGLAAEADVRAENVTLSRRGIEADVVIPHGRFRLQSALLGGFNLSNLLCAIAGGVALDLPLDAIVSGIKAVPVVPGRIETIENNRDALILVDYAHTGDALENVLQAVNELAGGRVITLFGCGGDRDRSKRPVMGEIAARFSDLAIVTSDNPRTEDPDSIINEILTGVKKHYASPLMLEQLQSSSSKGHVVVPDRREAIQVAVEILLPGDLLLVAGKGHEDYQIIGKEKVHFDDREEIRQALRASGRD